MVCGALLFAQNEPDQAEKKVKTTYGADGRPINQSQYAKGWHRVFGEMKFSGNGVDTVELNTSINNGKQDVSFVSEKTFTGRAWSLDGDNGNSYRVRPIGGNKVEIISSDSTDTNSIQYILEGE
jgi:hypothetical protein